jgi:hypothetical protein
MLRKKIKETLSAMKMNKEAMQAEYDEMMIYTGRWKEKRKKKIDIQMISACIAYAELLLKSGREQQPL